jgi:acyl-CoA thioesterase-2
MVAASLSAPEDRPASTFQLLFLRGADPDQRIEFEVKVLQEGKRFSSRHVSRFQGDGRVVQDAHAATGTEARGTLV